MTDVCFGSLGLPVVSQSGFQKSLRKGISRVQKLAWDVFNCVAESCQSETEP